MRSFRNIKGILFVFALVLAFASCGGWYENTKATLLSVNDVVNAYDDVAAEVFADVDSPEHPKFKKLELSMCFMYTVQDLLLAGWSTASMIDAGIMKKTDFGYWAAKVLLLVDTAINQWAVWDNVPAPVLGIQMYLRKYSPESVPPLDWTPPGDLECKKLVEQRVEERGK